MLNDRNAFTHFLKFYFPELPPRRAFFLAQGSRRVVYTYLSNRLEETCATRRLTPWPEAVTGTCRSAR